MADQLSHNDPDLTLARQIGNIRERDKSLTELNDDPLIQELLEYKQSKNQSVGAVPVQADKEEVWKNIQAAMQSSGGTPVRQLLSAATLRWAAAAVLVIGVIGYIYLQFSQQPKLVAQSGSSMKTVQLSDASVTLRPHSKLFAVDQNASALTYKLEGEGLFEVIHNPDRVFTVTTEIGQVNVLGTSFTLSSWGRQMQIYLQEGAVSVKALQRDSVVVLNPGQSASVSSPDTAPIVQTTNADEFTDWLDQQLIFNNKPASVVVNELEQHFNITVSLPGDVASSRLSGRLSLLTLQTSLDDLQLVLGGEFIKSGNRSYRFESK